jgi:hypothetical protein
MMCRQGENFKTARKEPLALVCGKLLLAFFARIVYGEAYMPSRTSMLWLISADVTGRRSEYSERTKEGPLRGFKLKNEMVISGPRNTGELVHKVNIGVNERRVRHYIV